MRAKEVAVMIPTDIASEVATALQHMADWYRSDRGHSAVGIAVLNEAADRLDALALVVEAVCS